jgi:hypothetical protein
LLGFFHPRFLIRLFCEHYPDCLLSILPYYPEFQKMSEVLNLTNGNIFFIHLLPKVHFGVCDTPFRVRRRHFILLLNSSCGCFFGGKSIGFGRDFGLGIPLGSLIMDLDISCIDMVYQK